MWYQLNQNQTNGQLHPLCDPAFKSTHKKIVSQILQPIPYSYPQLPFLSNSHRPRQDFCCLKSLRARYQGTRDHCDSPGPTNIIESSPKAASLPCPAFPMKTPSRLWIYAFPLIPTSTSKLTLVFPQVALLGMSCLLFLGELRVTTNFSFNSIDLLHCHSVTYIN